MGPCVIVSLQHGRAVSTLKKKELLTLLQFYDKEKDGKEEDDEEENKVWALHD